MSEINIKETFHDVLDIVNHMDVTAGVAYRDMKLKKASEVTEMDMTSILKALSDIERLSLKAGKLLVALKDEIYRIIDPITKRPR